METIEKGDAENFIKEDEIEDYIICNNDIETLKIIVDMIFPIQRKNLVVPIGSVKPQLMKLLKVNKWEFDKLIFELNEKFFDGNAFPFYFGSVGLSKLLSRLHYISRASQIEKATISNSYQYISVDDRNQFVQGILL